MPNNPNKHCLPCNLMKIANNGIRICENVALLAHQAQENPLNQAENYFIAESASSLVYKTSGLSKFTDVSNLILKF